ncbi:hypothetical protein LZC95_32365 [Pendulispora brunnea]|uniref:Rhamnogalacturonase A/B/Epimerase-like pectate lyase domain-containing protein n=1 Tax=Pendulispora brunnea TaxID=2905690 RepID=A0ABZ2JXQ7_9BACT
MFMRDRPSAFILRVCAAGLLAAGCGQSDATSRGAVDEKDSGPSVEPAGTCKQVAPEGTGGVLNVADFGAKPDGSDAFAGIQSAIDAACAKSVGAGSPPAVYLPAGRYALGRPLTAKCDGFELVGACRDGVTLQPKFEGPALVVTPDWKAIPTEPALVGTGRSAVTDGLNWHLDLREIPAVELNGKSALTVEAVVKLTGEIPGSSFITQSYGCISDTVFPCNQNGGAYGIGVVSVGAARPYLSASVMVGGRLVSVGGPAGASSNQCPREGGAEAWSVSLNEAHHVALTYDGAMVKLFLDGKKVACQAASGTIDQQIDETVSVGPYWQGFDMFARAVAIKGNIDSVRLSDTTRYTEDFDRPTVKLADDAATMALVNFEELPAPPPAPAGKPALVNPTSLTLAHSRGKPFWLPVRNETTVPDLVLNAVRLHDFTVDGGMGLFGYRVIGSRFSHLRCLGCDYGIAMQGLNRISSFEDIEATAGGGRGRFGLVSTSAGGSEFRDIKLDGQTIPFLNAGGAQVMLTNVTVTPNRTSTVYGMVLYYDSAVLNGVNVDASGTSSAWRGAIASVFPWSNLQIQGGHIGNMTNPNRPTSPILLHRLQNSSGSAAAVIQGTSFTGTASGPAVVNVVDVAGNPKLKPAVVLGGTKDSDVPWSNDPGLVSLGTDPTSVPDPSAIPRFPSASAVVKGLAPRGTVFDVTKFGAVANGVTDSYNGIQAAVDAACAAQHGGKTSTVFFPVGDKPYVVDKPVLVACNGLNLEGAQRAGSVLATRSGGGPALVLEPQGSRGFDEAAWVDLRDASPAGDIDGLAALTAEAIVTLREPSQGYAGILQSNGCLGSGGALPGCTSAFSLGVNGRVLTGSLTAGGKTYELQGPTLAVGTSYHVALGYDGHDVRLFASRVGGNPEPVASTPATGTISQGLHEDVTVGARTYGFGARVHAPGIKGDIDAVRLSKTALYAPGAYAAPSALPQNGEDTLAAFKLDDDVSRGTNRGYAIRGYVASYLQPVWFPVRRGTDTDGCTEPRLEGVSVRELSIDLGAGLFAMNAVKGKYASLALHGTAFGVTLAGDSSGSSFDEIILSRGTARTGIVVTHGDGNVYHHVNTGRVRLPLVIAGGSNQRFSDLFIDAPGAVYGSIFIDAGATVEALYNHIVTDHAAWKGSLLVVNPTAPFQLFKGEVDNGDAIPARADGTLSQAIPIIVDGGEGIRLAGTSFRSGATHCDPGRASPCAKYPAELIHINSRTRRPNVAIGVTWDDPRVLLTNEHDTSRFQSIGN